MAFICLRTVSRKMVDFINTVWPCTCLLDSLGKEQAWQAVLGTCVWCALIYTALCSHCKLRKHLCLRLSLELAWSQHFLGEISFPHEARGDKFLPQTSLICRLCRCLLLARIWRPGGVALVANATNVLTGVPKGSCSGYLNQHDVVGGTRCPRHNGCASCFWGDSKPSPLHDRRFGCNHLVDLVECWCVPSCAANCGKNGWLARQTGAVWPCEKGFIYLDSSQIKLYLRSVISLKNTITFQESLLSPLTDYCGALHVS